MASRWRRSRRCGLASWALVFDPGDAVVNVLADLFIASAAVVIYHVWASHERRRDAEVDAWRALRPLWDQLLTIGVEIDQGHARLREFDHHHIHKARTLWVEHYPVLARNPRLDLQTAYHSLVTGCPGPDVSEHVEKVGTILDGLVDDDFRLHEVLMEFQQIVRRPEPGWIQRWDRQAVQAIRAIRELCRRLSAALPELTDARDALHVRVAKGYYPQTVAENMAADPLPPAILKTSMVVAAMCSLAWLGGLWWGGYASAVLDNVLVGLAMTVLGAGVAKTFVHLRRHTWLTDQAAEPKEDLRAALGPIDFWAHVGVRDGWTDVRSEPAGRLTEAEAIKDVERARRTVRRALHRPQHIAPNAHVGAVGDKLDELIVRALAAGGDIRAMALIKTEVGQLRELIEEQFPGCRRDYQHVQRSHFGALQPPDLEPWDADLLGKRPGDDGVPDPSCGRWVARADKKGGRRWG